MVEWTWKIWLFWSKSYGPFISCMSSPSARSVGVAPGFGSQRFFLQHRGPRQSKVRRECHYDVNHSNCGVTVMIVLTITVMIMMPVILRGVIIRIVVITTTIIIIKALYTGTHLSKELEVQSARNTHAHTHMHSHTHTHMHTHTHAHTHTCTHTHTQADKHMHSMYRHMHNMYTRTCMQAHTGIYAYTLVTVFWLKCLFVRRCSVFSCFHFEIHHKLVMQCKRAFVRHTSREPKVNSTKTKPMAHNCMHRGKALWVQRRKDESGGPM